MGYQIQKCLADELNLAALIEASQDAVIGKDLDGAIVSWNKGAENLYGYKAGEVLGHSISILIPPGHPNEFPSIMQQLRRGKTIEGYETTRIHKDGHSIDVSITISPVKNNTGEVVGACAIARENRAHGLNLAALIEASQDAVIGKDLGGAIVSWNKGAEKIYGYKAEEVLGHSISILIPPGRPNEFTAIMQQLRRGQTIEGYETTRIHKDGHLIDVSITISPVRNNAGEVVGACAIARDISRHKKAEDELRLSEERFRVALKNAPVIVFSQDLDLRYNWINSPVLAWGRRDCIGLTDTEIIGGDEGARWTKLKTQVLRTGVGTHTEVTMTSEGITRFFDLVVEPLRNANGAIIGLISSAIDTTSWKDTIASLENALSQVQQLSGLIPMCASCKKISDGRKTWYSVESYIQAHSEAKFTHGLCPDCLLKLYPDYSPEPIK